MARYEFSKAVLLWRGGRLCFSNEVHRPFGIVFTPSLLLWRMEWTLISTWQLQKGALAQMPWGLTGTTTIRHISDSGNWREKKTKLLSNLSVSCFKNITFHILKDFLYHFMSTKYVHTLVESCYWNCRLSGPQDMALQNTALLLWLTICLFQLSCWFARKSPWVLTAASSTFIAFCHDSEAEQASASAQRWSWRAEQCRMWSTPTSRGEFKVW